MIIAQVFHSAKFDHFKDPAAITWTFLFESDWGAVDNPDDENNGDQQRRQQD